jgi:hypothetical protein
LRIQILSGAALLFAVAACDPTLGLGLPSERVLEDGAANTLTQAKSFAMKGSYSTSAGEQWTIDVQLTRPNTEHATATTGDQKVEAIIFGDVGYFRGQQFLAAHIGSDPLSQNLVRAAGSSWWKGSPGYIPSMREFTDGAAFRATFLGSANTQRQDHQTVDGQPAVQLSGARADVFIATTPPYHLLRVHLRKDVLIDAMVGADFHYRDFDRDFRISTPADVIDFSNLSTLPPIYTVLSVDTSRCGAPCVVSAQLKNLGGATGAIAPSIVTFTLAAAISGTVLGTCQATISPDVGYNGTTTVSCTITISSQPENAAVVTATANNPGRG